MTSTTLKEVSLWNNYLFMVNNHQLRFRCTSFSPLSVDFEELHIFGKKPFIINYLPTPWEVRIYSVECGSNHMVKNEGTSQRRRDNMGDEGVRPPSSRKYTTWDQGQEDSSANIAVDTLQHTHAREILLLREPRGNFWPLNLLTDLLVSWRSQSTQQRLSLVFPSFLSSHGWMMLSICIHDLSIPINAGTIVIKISIVLLVTL